MYVELIKNFHLAHTNKVMTVWIISTSLAQKHLIPISRRDVRRVHENFSYRRFERAIVS